ncbi:hypothetical protein ACFFRR_001678 [Megaselia abdita]
MEVKIRTLFCCIFSCSILLLYIISINNIGIDAASASKSSEPTDTNYISETPYFEEAVSKNVTAIAEDVAILKCRVKNKKNRTVSWMRKRDLHILTTNIYTYTGDQRFSVIHPPGSDDYDLRIEYTQPKDTGIYECQVNTEPKMNLALHLQITDIEDDIDPSQNMAIPMIPKEKSGGNRKHKYLEQQRSNSINDVDDKSDRIIETEDDNNNEIGQSYQPFDYPDDKNTDTYFKLLDRDEHPAGLTTNKGTRRITNFIFCFSFSIIIIFGLLPSIS